MNVQKKRYKGRRTGPVYNIIVNPTAADYSEKKIDFLIDEITRAGGKYFLKMPETPAECTNVVKFIISKRPDGIIACGGDGTVNLVARAMLRRTIGLGIFPMGRFNNIYHSLYGAVDLKKAADHILSQQTRKIDCGMAGTHFFLGSISFGLIPEMLEILFSKKSPRLAIGWSRLASQAAASTIIKPISLKIDAFGFELTPQTLSISILSHGLGLPLVPASIDNDGKCEVTFDVGKGTAIMSSYIRRIYKKKYIYSDEIRMFRGERIALANVRGWKMYLDGDLIDINLPELTVETYPGRIRVFYRSE